jgi:hypothetical protein
VRRRGEERHGKRKAGENEIQLTLFELTYLLRSVFTRSSTLSSDGMMLPFSKKFDVMKRDEGEERKRSLSCSRRGGEEGEGRGYPTVCLSTQCHQYSGIRPMPLKWIHIQYSIEIHTHIFLSLSSIYSLEL